MFKAPLISLHSGQYYSAEGRVWGQKSGAWVGMRFHHPPAVGQVIKLWASASFLENRNNDNNTASYSERKLLI